MFCQRATDKLMNPVWNKPAKAREMFRDANPAKPDGKNREDDERCSHRPGSLLSMFGFRCTRFPEEGQCDLAHRVKSRQEGSKGESPENPPVTMTKCIRQDFIL